MYWCLVVLSVAEAGGQGVAGRGGGGGAHLGRRVARAGGHQRLRKGLLGLELLHVLLPQRVQPPGDLLQVLSAGRCGARGTRVSGRHFSNICTACNIKAAPVHPSSA